MVPPQQGVWSLFSGSWIIPGAWAPSAVPESTLHHPPLPTSSLQVSLAWLALANGCSGTSWLMAQRSKEKAAMVWELFGWKGP